MIDETSLTPEETQPVSLDDAASKAFDTLAGVAEKTEAADTLPDAPKPFELPSYTGRWNQSAKDALKAIGEGKHHRSHLDPILAEIEEQNKRFTQRDQENADYRRNLDPVYDVLRPIEAQYRLQGMSLQQGVAQLVEGAKFVASDPDQAFPHFANIYKPRDAASAVQAIARTWGVDLGQLAQELPYVDPAVQALITPLQRQLAEANQFREQQQQQAQYQQFQAQKAQQEAIVQKLESLEAEKDESGALKYPHLAAVFDDIVMLADTGRAKTIEDAYAKALMMNPDLSQSVMSERAKAAEAKAIKDAAERSAAAQREANANRTTGGKGRIDDAPKSKNLNDALNDAYTKVYGTD